MDSSSFCQGKYTSAVFCLKPPPPSVCTVLLTLVFPSPPSEPRQAQETLGLVSLLYGLETTLWSCCLMKAGHGILESGLVGLSASHRCYQTISLMFLY